MYVVLHARFRQGDGSKQEGNGKDGQSEQSGMEVGCGAFQCQEMMHAEAFSLPPRPRCVMQAVISSQPNNAPSFG